MKNVFYVNKRIEVSFSFSKLESDTNQIHYNKLT